MEIVEQQLNNMTINVDDSTELEKRKEIYLLFLNNVRKQLIEVGKVPRLVDSFPIVELIDKSKYNKQKKEKTTQTNETQLEINVQEEQKEKKEEKKEEVQEEKKEEIKEEKKEEVIIKVDVIVEGGRCNEYLGFCVGFHDDYVYVSETQQIARINITEKISMKLTYIEDGKIKLIPIQAILPTFLHELAHSTTPAYLEIRSKSCKQKRKKDNPTLISPKLLKQIENFEIFSKNSFTKNNISTTKKCKDLRKSRDWIFEAHSAIFYRGFEDLLRKAEEMKIFFLPNNAKKFSMKSLLRFDGIDILDSLHLCGNSPYSFMNDLDLPSLSSFAFDHHFDIHFKDHFLHFNHQNNNLNNINNNINNDQIDVCDQTSNSENKNEQIIEKNDQIENKINNNKNNNNNSKKEEKTIRLTITNKEGGTKVIILSKLTQKELFLKAKQKFKKNYKKVFIQSKSFPLLEIVNDEQIFYLENDSSLLFSF